MDDTLTSWYDWIDVGRFDFERGGTLKQDISYFVHSKFHIHHTVIGMWMARWLLIKQKQRLLGLFLQSAFPEKAALRQQALQVEQASRQDWKIRINEMMNFLNELPCELTDYEEQYVRTLVEKVTVYDEYFIIEFKSGIEIQIYE